MLLSKTVKKINMQRGIEGQIELLENMLTFLSNSIENFEELIKAEEWIINELDSEGLDRHQIKNFEERLIGKRNLINKLIHDIETYEIPKTRRVINHLESTPK